MAPRSLPRSGTAWLIADRGAFALVSRRAGACARYDGGGPAAQAGPWAVEPSGDRNAAGTGADFRSFVALCACANIRRALHYWLLARIMLPLQLVQWFGPVEPEITLVSSLMAFTAFGLMTLAAWWVARSEVPAITLA